MKKILMKKTKKILIQLLKNFYNFLHTYIKMVNKYYQKKKKSFAKKHVKGTKIFLKKKKKKGEKRLETDVKIFLKKKKKKRLNI